MFRKRISLLIAIAFLNFSLFPAYAQEAIVLSDSELDQVHAGGLPEISLVNTVNVPQSPISPNLVNTPEHPLSPVEPNTASSPNTPNMPAIPIGPLVPTGAVTPNVPNTPLDPNSPSVPGIPNSPDNPSLPNTPSVPNVPNTPLGPNVPSVPGLTVAPVSPAIPAAPVSPAAPSAPAIPATPAQAATPASPIQPMVFDASVSSDGDIGFAYRGGNPAQSQALQAIASGGGSINSIEVTETAQQNLSSLVNVNAAGSVVPIQINLTVIMNSTVSNVSNNNSLNFSSFTTFQ